MLNRLSLPYTKHRIKKGCPVLSTFLYLQNRITYDPEMDGLYQKFRQWDGASDHFESMVNWIHRVDEYFQAVKSASAFPFMFGQLKGLGPQNHPMLWTTETDEHSLLDIDIVHVVFEDWVLLATEASDRPYLFRLHRPITTHETAIVGESYVYDKGLWLPDRPDDFIDLPVEAI